MAKSWSCGSRDRTSRRATGRSPDETAECFDDEGYYKIGDALKFADPERSCRGFVFDGRVTEDFKLATGTWVNMAAVRSAVIAACAPLIRDVVLTGLDRNLIGALIFPDVEACAALGDEAAIGAAFARAARQRWRRPRPAAPTISRARSSSSEPPSIDAGEITDKGSINQRAVMAGARRWSRISMPSRRRPTC